MSKFSALAIIATITLSSCAGHNSKITGIMAEVQTAGKAKNFQGIATAASKLDDKYFTPQLLSSYSDQTISELFQTLRYPAVYLPDNAAAPRQMATILEEKTKRRIQTEEDVRQTFSALAEARLFDSAERVRQSFPGLSLTRFPNLISGVEVLQGKWQTYDISADGTSMRLVQLPMDSGPKIVMFMLPGCPSGIRAIREILADKALGPVFRQHAVILLRKLDPAAVETLKKTFAFPAVYIARKSADFPGIEMMHSPDCFFLKDGKVLSRHRGWSDSQEHNMNLTLAGLAKIGIPVKPETK